MGPSQCTPPPLVHWSWYEISWFRSMQKLGLGWPGSKFEEVSKSMHSLPTSASKHVVLRPYCIDNNVSTPSTHRLFCFWWFGNVIASSLGKVDPNCIDCFELGPLTASIFWTWTLSLHRFFRTWTPNCIDFLELGPLNASMFWNLNPKLHRFIGNLIPTYPNCIDFFGKWICVTSMWKSLIQTPLFVVEKHFPRKYILWFLYQFAHLDPFSSGACRQPWFRPWPRCSANNTAVDGGGNAN